MTILSYNAKIVSMYHHRYLENVITELCFNTGKMAFISGPRQCGKTTMAKLLLRERAAGAYYNWDEVKFRRMWVKDPSLIIPRLEERNGKVLIILDELHKAKLWKRSLKGLYDTEDDTCDILVTGSARLNVYRKGSDSLMGRYYHFRLHPFSVAELLQKTKPLLPEILLERIFSDQIIIFSEQAQHELQKLYEFGPFPEPLFATNARVLHLWQRNRLEKIIREDLRDLSRLPELSQVEMLASLLPERVAQPLGMQALAEDLEVSYTTIKRWLNYLNELYYFFALIPYSKSLARAIIKEKKIYLWDWSEVENAGAKFENLIAAHLLKYCDYLSDIGIGNFDLRYLKNKEKEEIDFLILKNNKPMFAVEAKLTDEYPNASWHKFMQKIKCPYGIQLVKTPQVQKLHDYGDFKVIILSAAEFLAYLV